VLGGVAALAALRSESISRLLQSSWKCRPVTFRQFSLSVPFYIFQLCQLQSQTLALRPLSALRAPELGRKRVITSLLRSTDSLRFVTRQIFNVGAQRGLCIAKVLGCRRAGCTRCRLGRITTRACHE
jgi:hypothetical protein